MNIVQISDLHLPSSKESLVDGTNTQAISEKLLTYLHQNEKVDLLVVTGDISCLAENHYAYDFLLKLIKKLNFKSVVMPGNHDRGSLFQNYFDFGEYGSLYKEFENFNLIFFDTSCENENVAELKKLENFLLSTQKITFLFTHYPPVKVGHPTYDNKHKLNWSSNFLNSLTSATFPVYVFFGHIHFEFQKQINHLWFYSVPSATTPIKPGINCDYPDEKKGYYRTIKIFDKKCETQLKYLPSNLT